MADEMTEEGAGKRIVVEARVRELLPLGMKLDAHTIDELDRKVRGMFNDAVNRCTHNGRKTVRAADL